MSGFYVDVGAHHPRRFSNTYYLYKMGWRGINIEPMPGIVKKFNRIRPKDINLAIGAGAQDGEQAYYIFKEKALNTFSEELAKEYMKTSKLIRTETIKIYTLKSILDKYLGDSQVIDIMSIDAEGYDFQILKFNDWDKYSPKILMVETYEYYARNFINSDIAQFLFSKNYDLVAKTIHTCIFEKVQQAPKGGK